MPEDLLTKLRSLEEALHTNEVRRSPEKLEQLLHPQFEEIGRSGRKYERAMIVEALLQGGDIPKVLSGNYTVSLLSEGVALLTYESAHVGEAGQSCRESRRSSLWLGQAGRWQLRFHQGTPTNEK